MSSLSKKLLFVFLVLGLASSALAIPPTWMPGFPMRMGTNVMLMWTPVPGATAYNVYKSGKEGDLGQKVVSSPMNNHMDVNIPLDQSAFYVVKAVVGAAESSEASMVGKIIGVKPLEATKFSGHMDADTGVSLRFDPVGGASFYNVFKSESEQGPYNLMGSVQETRYTDASVQYGKTYYYQVTAVDKNSMESPRSPTYVYSREKKKEEVLDKQWKQVDRMVDSLTDIYGPEERPLTSPTWLATDGTYLVVSDAKGVAVFDDAGELVRDLRPPATYAGQWGTVRGVAASSDGFILISFVNPAVIRAMDPNDGSVAKEFPVQTPTAGAEIAPRGMVEDSAGNLWVAEPLNGQIHVYDTKGNLIKMIGVPGVKTFEPQDMKLLSLLMYHKPTNRVYAVDPTVRYIRAFDAAKMDFITGEDGKPFYGWKRPGGAVGYVQEVRGITVLDDGSILLVDGLDGRLQIFTPNLDYVASLTDKPGEKKPSTAGSATSAVMIGQKLYLAQPFDGKIAVFDLGKK